MEELLNSQLTISCQREQNTLAVEGIYYCLESLNKIIAASVPVLLFRAEEAERAGTRDVFRD